MSEFIFWLVVIGVLIFIIVPIAWGRFWACEEMSTIDERTLNPTADEEGWFQYYESSFKRISRYTLNGKHRAFWYAFKVGYTVGKIGHTIYPKEYEKYLREKGGESHE